MTEYSKHRFILHCIRESLNTIDRLIRISERIEARDWDNIKFGNFLALTFHLCYLLAQVNLKCYRYSRNDISEPRWMGCTAVFVIFFLRIFSVLNAFYTFYHTRQYRLFESSINTPQFTSSARRVRVDSLPNSPHLFKIFSNLLGDASAESRAHPDSARDVWEISVWDPVTVCLRLFCLFSPGHALIYWLFFPTNALDIYPSVTVAKVVCLQILMSAQLSFVESKFSQQIKDFSVIQSNVLSEYNTKFVHPRLNSIVRDAGTQNTSAGNDISLQIYDNVVFSKPMVNIKKGFNTRPNPQITTYLERGCNYNLNHQNNSPVEVFTTLKNEAFRNEAFSSFIIRSTPEHIKNRHGVVGSPTNLKSPLSKASFSDNMHIRSQNLTPGSALAD